MQFERLNRMRQIFCAVICASFMVSCMPKEPEYIDVAAKFLEMLQDRSYHFGLATNMLFLLEPESYDDWDLFYSDLPPEADKHYPSHYPSGDYNVIAPISVVRIDTIDTCAYKVKLKIGKKYKNISLRVSENNKLITQLHGTGVPGRYHFSNVDYELRLYRTATEKPADERYKERYYIDGTEYYEEDIASIGNGYGCFYILKKTGKKRSQISYCRNERPPEICWVDNKYLDRSEEFRARDEITWKDYAESVLAIPLILMPPFLLAAVFGGGAAVGGIAIIFF